MPNETLIASAVAYIEAHLQEPFTLQDVARVAGYSPFHFHRLFLAVMGETPAAFIRRRRLAESARELAETEKRAIDVALAYQYDSQEAFIRAFRRHFGVTPGQYRRCGVDHGQGLGGSRMEPRFVALDGFTLVGMIYFGENQKGEIPQLWTEFNARSAKIPHQLAGKGYGFCFMDGQSNPNFWYMASMAVEQLTTVPPEMVAKTVPAAEYAVFTHRGPVSTLGETYGFAYQTWMPTSGYEPAANYDFEYYDQRFNPQDPANSELDIYIPVRRKG
ncbi:MAG: AraC family transcriptional regulator [Mycobacterium leprae]